MKTKMLFERITSDDYLYCHSTYDKSLFIKLRSYYKDHPNEQHTAKWIHLYEIGTPNILDISWSSVSIVPITYNTVKIITFSMDWSGEDSAKAEFTMKVPSRFINPFILETFKEAAQSAYRKELDQIKRDKIASILKRLMK